MASRKIAPWWKFGFIALIAIGILYVVSYQLGGTGVRVKGSQPSIDRNADAILLKLSDTHALYITPKYKDSIDVVTYKDSGFFRFLGEYSKDTVLFAHPAVQGDWYYTLDSGFFEPGRVIAVNIKTGDVIKKTEQANGDLKFFPENLKAAGLNPEAGIEVTYNNITNYEELSTPKESAKTIIMAFGILFIVWTVLLPIAYRKPASAT